jgi:hypothetical protein
VPRLSNFFRLNSDQAQLDFVDIDTDRDARFYVDPYALELRSDEWCENCSSKIRSYFISLLDALRASDVARLNLWFLI